MVLGIYIDDVLLLGEMVSVVNKNKNNDGENFDIGSRDKPDARHCNWTDKKRKRHRAR